MQTAHPARPQGDNLLGVCHALGETFGIDPLYLRIAMALGLLANFGAAVILYFALAAVLLAARLVEGAIGLGRRQRAGTSLT